MDLAGDFVVTKVFVTTHFFWSSEAKGENKRPWKLGGTNFVLLIFARFLTLSTNMLVARYPLTSTCVCDGEEKIVFSHSIFSRKCVIFHDFSARLGVYKFMTGN